MGQLFVLAGSVLHDLTNPELDEQKRDRLVHELMDARRAVKKAKAKRDEEALAAARRAVSSAKMGLGERGPVWWTDGSPDLNRQLAKNTPYAEWFSEVQSSNSVTS